MSISLKIAVGRFVEDVKRNSFNILVFASLFGIFLLFAFCVDGGALSLIFKVLSALSESSFCMVFLCLLRGRWKIVSIAFVYITALLLIANELFFRNFSDLIPASSYFNSSLDSQMVIEGAVSSFRIKDILFVIIASIPLLYAIFFQKKFLTQISVKKHFVFFLVVFVASTLLSFAGSYRRVGIYNHTTDFREIIRALYPRHATDWRFHYYQHTFHGYLFKCILTPSGRKEPLSDEDIELIKSSFIEKNARNRRHSSSQIADSTNLIMIIVESLPAKIIDSNILSDAAPNLRGLLNDSSAIVKRAKVLAGIGRSSDAQFIYNTGLLPLRHEPLVTSYALQPYPSLPKALGMRSAEIIGEGRSLWSHGLTSLSYGFDELIDNIAPDGENQDSIIFAAAIDYVRDFESPFFLEVTTLSMHDPYLVSKVDSDVKVPESVTDSRDVEYMRRLHYFDKSLGDFIARLKKTGLYDKSVIVILGDHDTNRECVSALLYDDEVPVIILNSPYAVEPGRPATQLDVFPTILDIFNADYTWFDTPYSGLGYSFFCDTAHPTPQESDYRISELLIKCKP